MSYVSASRGMAGRRRGLGQSLPLAYCQSLGLFDFVKSPGCWGWGVPNVLVPVATPSPPMPVANLPPPANVPPSSGSEAQAAVDSAIAANVAANQAATQQFFGNVAQNAGDVNAGLNWGLLLLTGLGLFVGALVVERLSRPY